MTKSLNQLIHIEEFIGFSLKKNGPQVNHLGYLDNLVLFFSGDRKTIKMVMRQLKEYQIVFGQEINKDKSAFMIHDSTTRLTKKRLKRWTGYKYALFPFTYLGCLIYTEKKRISYFSGITNNIMNKVISWKGKLLSAGGEAIIIKHILQSQILHTFAALMPPVTIFKEIEMYFSNFFGTKRAQEQISLELSRQEGGLGFKRLIDICYVFNAKRWWRF